MLYKRIEAAHTSQAVHDFLGFVTAMKWPCNGHAMAMQSTVFDGRNLIVQRCGWSNP